MAVLSEWLEEEALMEVLEVLEVAEELLEAEDLTTAPRLKDCSLSVWVLVVPAAVMAGLTASFLTNRFHSSF